MRTRRFPAPCQTHATLSGLRLGLWLALLLPCSALPADANKPGPAITVHAGEFDRSNTPVAFMLPEPWRGATQLRAGRSKPIPLQISAAGEAVFILPSLAKGQSVTYELDLRSPRLAPTVTSRSTADQVLLGAGQDPALTYQAQPGPFPRPDIDPAFRRGGYLHPIRTPSGRVITDDFPSNHIHHHGVWFAWTNTEFDRRKPDFWNMGQKKGTIEPVALDETWSGAVHSGLKARHRFVDLTASTPTTVLNETWEVRLYADSTPVARYRVFDLVSSQTCAGDKPLHLPEYHYGGIGFRGAWAWNGTNHTFFLTSEGETDRVKGHATRARWCHIGGLTGGALAGIAVLGHPSNFRAPQPMRIHPSEPFFCYAPQQLGPMDIKPGETYVSRYRFVVADGAPDRAELDRLWNDYAHPPRVEVR